MRNKLHVLLLLSVLCVLASPAKAQDYKFVSYTLNYLPHYDGKSITDDLKWDEDIFGVKIGFPFRYYGKTFDSVYISDGYVSFDKSSDYTIDAFLTDLIDKGDSVSNSPITIQRTGSAGDRVFSIEWSNAAFYNDTQRTDNVSFQLQLYETTNNIIVHIGPNTVSQTSYGPGFTGPSIGLTSRKENRYYYLAGSAASPIVSTTSQANLVGTPAEKSVFKFESLQVNGLNEFSETGIRCYPVPAKDNFRIEGVQGRCGVHVYDIAGKKVLEKDLNTADETIDIAALKPGLYFVRIHQENRLANTRLLIEK